MPSPHTNFSKLPSLRTAISAASQLSQQLVPLRSRHSSLVLQAVTGLVRISVTLHCPATQSGTKN
jgi:hypothetical protein